VPLFAAVAVVVVALNLRAAVASAGPLVDDIRDDLSLSSTAMDVLTSLPVFCFGGLAVLGPWLARRVGLHRAVGWCVVLLLVGLLVRLGPDPVTLFAGTVLAAAAIAAVNVLLPVVVKRDFAQHTGLMMGLYTTAVTGSAAAGAGLTVPLGDAAGGGWRAGLGIWAVLAAVGVALWVPFSRHDAAPDPASARPATRRMPLRGQPLAWMVTAFFGLQSLSFYAVLAWLPSLYEDHGWSAGSAGGLLSLSALVQLPGALVLPTIASRMRRQVALVWWSVALTAIGLFGILVAPTTIAPLWAVVLGLGQGGTFTLGLTLLVLRSGSAASTGQLSSMAQSVGYLVAGFGPLVFGVLHAATGSWSPPLIFLLVLLVPEIVVGVVAALPGVVSAVPSEKKEVRDVPSY
jgi:CP family cyanate transporter-like MFS transporter